jgi:hypothetical protein
MTHLKNFVSIYTKETPMVLWLPISGATVVVASLVLLATAYQSIVHRGDALDAGKLQIHLYSEKPYLFRKEWGSPDIAHDVPVSSSYYL